ncbi:hypothetical protein [Desulfovibrio ferrophilus]|uniref:Uncharacterized protein n=1 Tax=Desulfovibrio ferrophilus TaxID=241368 RepID=A0A2Z6AU36_9BACT|nr:hypothetical protein [Desulfovibrio ferrophilus]BBD06745.1 putative uncharacterized protein [Desulfovibrio ferrophilus]
MKPMMKLHLLSREGIRAANAGNYANALFTLHQALLLTQGIKAPLHEAKVLSNIALILMMRGENIASHDHLCRALPLVENHAGRDNSLYRRISGQLKQAA